MSKQLITQNSNATGANSKNILHRWISELKNEDMWSKWAVLTHPLLACNGPSPSEYILLLNPGPYYKHWAVNARLRKKKLHNLRPKVLGLQIPGNFFFFYSAGATLIHGGIAGISRRRWNIKLSAAHHWLKLFFFSSAEERGLYSQQGDIWTNTPDIAWYCTGLRQAATADQSCQWEEPCSLHALLNNTVCGR